MTQNEPHLLWQATVTASGKVVLAPLVVFKGEPGGRIAQHWFATNPIEMLYACQEENAWMDEKVMLMWVDKILKSYVMTSPYRVACPNCLFGLVLIQYDVICCWSCAGFWCWSWVHPRRMYRSLPTSWCGRLATNLLSIKSYINGNSGWLPRVCLWNNKLSTITTQHLQVDAGCLPKPTWVNDSKLVEARGIHMIVPNIMQGVPPANHRIPLSRNEWPGDWRTQNKQER